MKKKETFLEISPDECLRVYQKVRLNADELFVCSRLLQQQQFYGKAISLLILGVEEYIKSFFLFLEGNGFQLRKQEGIKPIFYRHTARHGILRETFSVWMVFKQFYSIRKPYSGKNIIRHSLKALLMILPAISMNEWWKNADHLKQNGLYADYRDGLIVPSDLSNDDFNTALRFTEPVPKEIDELIGVINKMKPQELKEFRESFHLSDLSLLIVESFDRK